MNSIPINFMPPENFSNVMWQSYEPVVSLSLKKNLIAGIPDGVLALVAPIIAYWGYATVFHIIDVYELAEKYRIHPSEEEEARNKATLKDVVKDVVIQHIIQTVVGGTFFLFDPPQTTGHEWMIMWNLRQKYVPLFVPDNVVWVGYMYGWTFLRICIAIGIIDTWQYWLHRIMHINKTLYRKFHSRHHRLYVPYAYGALYNDPVEGFLLDTLGTGIATIVTNLSHRESIILFTFATLKTVDDHCGYRLPFDIFQIIFPNNSLYHDIHHQTWGVKNNFSQPFFTFWDKLNKTDYKFVNEYKSMQDHITLTRYREFLANKQRKPNKKPVNTEPEKKKDI